MTLIHNMKNEKKKNFKYASEDLERNEIDTMKMYEAVKKIKQLAPKEKLIIKTKEELTSNEIKSVRNHSKIFRKHFFKRNTNVKRITNTDGNTIPISRSKKTIMDTKK